MDADFDETADERLDLEQIVEHCKVTLFKVLPTAFNAAYKAAIGARNELNGAVQAFGLDPPKELNDLDAQIHKADVIKMENIALGILSESIMKPMKLKRELRIGAYNQIKPSVWAEMHETVTRMIEQTIGVPSSKKLKDEDSVF